MVVDLIIAAVFLYCIVLTAVVLLGGRTAGRRPRRDSESHYSNDRGQLVAQLAPEDLVGWLERHRSFEIVSMANVGPYVLVVYK